MAIPGIKMSSRLQNALGGLELRVLLVEDGRSDALLVIELLDDVYGDDYTLVQATSCKQALDLIRAQDFDVALIDYCLPDGFGVDLIEVACREAPGLATILFIGHLEESVDLEAMAAGASDIISKSDLQKAPLERSIRYSVERQKVALKLRRSEAELVRRNDELSSAQAQLGAQTNNMILLAEHLAQSEGHEEVAFIVPHADNTAKGDIQPHALTEHGQVCIWHISPEGTSRHMNQAMASLLEIPQEEIDSPADFLSCFDGAVRDSAAGELAKWSRGIATAFEAAVVGRRSGDVKQLVLSGSPLLVDTGGPAGLLITAVDITERRRIEASTRELARQDPLTGLLNRNSLNEHLTQALASANRIGRSVGLLCLDLDDFKSINDSLGHPFGDKLLTIVAERLKSAVRASDSIARLGGDEFVVILNHLESSDQVSVPAQAILDRLAEPFSINGETAFTGASIGIAVYPADADSPEDLLKKADMALYRSKEISRGGYEFFDHNILERLQRRRELEPALRQAAQRNELRLMYQPQVDLATGDTVGVEALLRWNSAAKGFLDPSEFIPLAESSGLIVPIGDWVFGEACRQLRVWQESGFPDLRLSVNVSMVQLKRAGFTDSVQTMLEETGVKPESLMMEVTESGVLQNLSLAKETLGTLNDLGIGIALDDFGTGFASLALLKEFPFEQIKIDRSFIENIETDEDCAAIVSTTITLGRKLGLRVIGEGVETEEQLAFLRAESCEEAQGFLFSKPMRADDFGDWRFTGHRLQAASVAS